MWRKRLLEAQSLKHRVRINRKNFGGRPPREYAKQHRDLAAHKVSVRISPKIQLFRRIGTALRNQPDLAYTAAHAGEVSAFLVAQRLQCAREFDHMRDAFFPIGQERELVREILDRLFRSVHALHMRFGALAGKARLVAPAAAGDRRHGGGVWLGYRADAGADIAQAVLTHAERILIPEARGGHALIKL